MTPRGTDPYEKWPAIGMPPVRGPELLYGRVRAEKAPTRQQLALTPEAEALELERARARAAGERHRSLVKSPPPGLLERMLGGLQRLPVDEAIVPEIPDTPAELLAMPAPEPEPQGWREWLAAMAYGAARWTEPPVPSGCGACRDSLASWCGRCADAIEAAAALDRLHDEIIAAPDMATALRLMAESATWRTTHGETAVMGEG
jgi:hypothetical protein